MIYISCPGHGGPALVANTYLEGTYSEVYPNITQDPAGLRKLFRQFSFPGGIPSHVAPETPGSIHEGGELGYSLSHAFGAVLDNPGLIVACCGWAPIFVEGHEPEKMHQAMVAAVDQSIDRIRQFQRDAREKGAKNRPIWPIIVLRSPKGWTGPKVVNGLPVEGTFRSHQVPLADPRRNPRHLEHKEYICKHGQDMPEILNWKWQG